MYLHLDHEKVIKVWTHWLVCSLEDDGKGINFFPTIKDSRLEAPSYIHLTPVEDNLSIEDEVAGPKCVYTLPPWL